jgi:hypothetical protein
VHGLQGLGHDHDVEAVAGEVAQALVQVLLDDVDALGHASAMLSASISRP